MRRRNNKDLILAALAGAAAPLCDDCLATRSGVSPRQAVFQLCTALAAANRIVRQRRSCKGCGKAKNTSAVASVAEVEVATPNTARIVGSVETRTDDRGRRGDDKPWHWEGHVQRSLAGFLGEQGWKVTATADTASKEPGIDIVATKDGRWLAVEVKGYPSTKYEYGPKRGEPKPTSPSNQARQWFSHALLSMMLLRHKRPDAEIAVCFPDFPTFRRLAAGTQACFETLGFGFYFVSQDGGVRLDRPHRPLRHSASPPGASR